FAAWMILSTICVSTTAWKVCVVCPLRTANSDREIVVGMFPGRRLAADGLSATCLTLWVSTLILPMVDHCEWRKWGCGWSWQDFALSAPSSVCMAIGHDVVERQDQLSKRVFIYSLTDGRTQVVVRVCRGRPLRA